MLAVVCVRACVCVCVCVCATGFVRHLEDVVEKKRFQFKISDYVNEVTAGTDHLQLCACACVRVRRST